MALIQGWLPPSRENWELISTIWSYFPLITLFQWVVDWYPQGKTSEESILNLPGKIGWFTMEIPGVLTLLYVVNTLPAELGIQELPWQSKIMAALFTLHYLYRAVIFPYINPSMSPIHILVWIMAFFFQVFNAICIAGWISGYGPQFSNASSTLAGKLTSQAPSGTSLPIIYLGTLIWALGLLSNIYHDSHLRHIRRTAAYKQHKHAEQEAKVQGKPVEEIAPKMDKIYVMPTAGLFQHVLYAHYLCEWIEWAGFWVVGGWACFPARNFLVHEVSTMFPRAVQGKRWYVKRFGKAEVGSRMAIVPGVV